MAVAKKLIHVASAVILKDGKVLLTQRNENQKFPLYWEFPGGKIEPYEKPVGAIVRELIEELDIAPSFDDPCMLIGEMWVEHEDVIYHINQFLITKFEGEIKLKVGQKQMQWVPIAELSNYQHMPSQYSLIEEMKKWPDMSK